MNKPIDHIALHTHRRTQRGMSLVELMVAITLGIFLIWGVTQSFLTSKQVYRLQQGMARIQENGRLAQEFLGYDIRNAGDYGCANGDNYLVAATVPPDARNDATCTATVAGNGMNLISSTSSLDDEFEYAVYGFNDVAAGTAPYTLTGAGKNPPSSDTSVTAILSKAPRAGTDVLMVHVSQDVGTVTNIVTGTATNYTAFNINTNAQFINSTVQKERLAVSDCATTRIYGVQNMGALGATLTTADSFCYTANFIANATARKVDTVYYFVADNGRGATGDPSYSLYRQTGGGSTAVAQELLEGVEDLQLQYGIDYGTGGAANDFVVDVYKDAGSTSGNGPTTAAGWSSAWDGWDLDSTNAHREYTLVRAVRYSLLIRTTDDNVVQDYQTYSWKSAAVTSTDHRLREIFSGTVGIRSRSL
jgi:type IV pilus assembly protein PilW